MQVLGDVFFLGLATGNKPSLKKSKSVSTGATKVSKLGRLSRGAGYVGAAIFVGYSIYNNIEEAEYFCSPLFPVRHFRYLVILGSSDISVISSGGSVNPSKSVPIANT